MKVFHRHFFQLIQRHSILTILVAAPIVTAVILLTTMIFCDYAPFGQHSLAVADARIQYLDFFGYLKNVFSGQDSLLFSFSKGLGGGCLALFAYYLASPLNILIIFFQHADLNTFFNIIFFCKAILASFTFALFLSYRFREFLRQGTNHYIAIRCIVFVILACCYGLSQYALAQASNIMWLDGVIMLPLLMLATYRIIQGYPSYPLAILTGCAILFNWYSAGIDCLFVIFWFIIELSLKFASQTTSLKQFLRQALRPLLRFILALALGVLLSSILFLPTITSLLGTSHATPNLVSVFKPNFVGAIPTLIERYSLGAGSIFGAASIFCGSLPLIGTIMVFISKRIQRRTKFILAAFLAVLVLALYWNPLIMLFSMFEQVGSYWYRYSFIAIAGLIFLSAYYFAHALHVNEVHRLLRASLLTGAVMIVVQYIHSATDLNLTYRTVILLLLITLCLVASLSSKTKKRRLLSLSILLLVACLEIGYESYLFLRGYNEIDTTAYANYISSTNSLLSEIKRNDQNSNYRISTTSNQYTDEAGILGATANYNESLSFGYRSLSTYTSTPDELQLQQLAKLGYRSDFDIRTIVNTSILGTDSLLGVKYVLSKYPINGLELLSAYPADSIGRQIYKNPYALPIALPYANNTQSVDSGDTFIYQNQFYSKLLGRDVKLYQPVAFRQVQNDHAVTYTLTIPSGNYALYGNIPATGENPGLILNVAEAYSIAYATTADQSAATLVPSVFYIPTNGSKQTLQVSLASDQAEYHIGSAEFYLLDLNLLGKITEELLNRPQAQVNLQQASASIDITCTESNQSLYISLSTDPGWRIYRNGTLITPDSFGDGFLSIPLATGENHIQLIYHASGFQLGIIMSSLGVVSIVLLYFYESKHRRTHMV